VLAAFRVEEGGRAGAILPVVRGRLDGTGEDRSADLAPNGALAVPDGRVRLVGTLSPGEASLDVPAGNRTLGSVSPGQLANLWGSPIYGGYLRLTSAEPPETSALAPAPAPTRARGPLPLQNLAYAVQWWVFGAFALAVWVRLVRDEAARLEE
jgi:cytochrome oxidase assembly protein ShyY1